MIQVLVDTALDTAARRGAVPFDTAYRVIAGL